MGAIATLIEINIMHSRQGGQLLKLREIEHADRASRFWVLNSETDIVFMGEPGEGRRLQCKVCAQADLGRLLNREVLLRESVKMVGVS